MYFKAIGRFSPGINNERMFPSCTHVFCLVSLSFCRPSAVLFALAEFSPTRSRRMEPAFFLVNRRSKSLIFCANHWRLRYTAVVVVIFRLQLRRLPVYDLVHGSILLIAKRLCDASELKKDDPEHVFTPFAMEHFNKATRLSKK